MRDVPDIVAKSGDTQPVVQTLTASGSAVDLTGATVRLILVPIEGGTPLTRAGSVIVPETGGRVGVSFETVPAGDYAGEYEVTDSGLVKSYPDGGNVWVRVWADLD